MSIKKDASKILDDASRMLKMNKNTEAIVKEIENMKKMIDEPLRVVVIGTVKAGKSTLINALLKKQILFTGDIEKTSVPTWFKYDKKKAIKIVYNDGRTEEQPFENLERWTVKEKTDQNENIDDVSYVEVRCPNEIFKAIEIIDTPGFGGDVKASLKSVGFLGFGENKSGGSDIISKEASKAEAIIFAFSGENTSKDMEVLNKFQSDLADYNISQINAVCVFTKGDLFWNPEVEKDPLELAKEERDRLMKQRSEKNIMLDVAPVCARILEALYDFGENERKILGKLAKLDTDALTKVLSNKDGVSNLGNDELDNLKSVELDEDDMEHIIQICPVYGIYVIASLLNEGCEWDRIERKLDEISGIARLRDKVNSHFGNRATIIKVDYMFSYLRSLIVKTMGSLSVDSNVYKTYENLKGKIDDMKTEQIVFNEIIILKDYYRGLIDFNDDMAEKYFLQMMGENGMSCEKRLGFTDDVGIKQLARGVLDRKEFWDKKSADPFIGRGLKRVAIDMSRSCDYIYDYIAWLLGE